MCTSVIYSRCSSAYDTHRQNTERQVLDLQAYADQNGMDVLKVFEEYISGAKKNNERPVLLDCLDYCFAYNVSVLLLSELSRLGRNVDEVLANVRLCKDRHLNIFFQKENLSIFQDDGKENPFLTIMIAVLGTCAQMERENIQFRLQSGRKNYIEKYGTTGLGRPIGSVKTKELMEDQYKQVIKELRHGTSIRRTAKLCDVACSTVQKVKKEFDL